MDNELKTYLEGMESRLATKEDVNNLLEVIQDVKENTVRGFERIEERLDKVEELLEKHDARLNKLEDRV